MTIEDVQDMINNYKKNTFICITRITLNTNLFNGYLLLNDGTLFKFDVLNPDSANFVEYAKIQLNEVNDLKNYLIKSGIFEKKYQETKIDNQEFKSYINIEEKIIDIKNDFISIYEPSLYKTLNYWIFYLLTKTKGYNQNEYYDTINNNIIDINSKLKNFKASLKISNKNFKKLIIIKIKVENNKTVRLVNNNITYFIIKLIYMKYDTLFMAPGAKLKHKNIINYLEANYDDGPFETLEERDALREALKELFFDIGFLR